MLENDLVRALLGCPHLAAGAVSHVEPMHFVDFEARVIFDAILECLDDGEKPVPHRVAARVRSRIPDFGPDVASLGAVVTHSALMDMARAISARGTKRQMAIVARQVADHIDSVVDNDQISPSEVQSTLNAAVAAAMARSRKPIRSLSELGEEVVDQVQSRFDGESEQIVWDIGIHRIDRRLLSGPGKVTLIGADSGHGKSSFATWYLAQALKRFIGLGCLYIPLADMSPHDTAGRRLAAVSKQDSNNILHRTPDSVDDMAALRDALKRMQQSYGKRFFVAKPGKTLAEIFADVRRGCLQMRQEGLRPGIVVIDYAQVVKSSDKINRFERLERLAEMAEEISDELSIHVIITSQLNSEPGKSKPGEGRAPRITDIWGGKEMEWYSDSALILIRKDRKKAQPCRDANGIEIPQSSPSYAPIPQHLRAVYHVDLWGLKGRSGTDEHPAQLDYLAPVCVYQEPGTGDLNRWNSAAGKPSAASQWAKP